MWWRVKRYVSSDESVREMVDKTIAQYGKLDYAFNNAGVEGLSAPRTNARMRFGIRRPAST